MFWFKKKKEPEVLVVDLPPLKTRTKKLIFEEQEFNIGVTEVELLFDHKEIIVKRIYGVVEQWSHPGSDEIRKPCRANPDYRECVVEPNITKVDVYPSLQNARHYISNLYGWQTIVDDEKNITKTATGNIIVAKILETKDFIIKHNVAKIVPVEV